MPVSGLVLTCHPAEDAVTNLVRDLTALPGFKPGTPNGRRVPVVLDSPDKDTDRQRHDWLQSHPSVFSLDIAFVHFDTPQSADHSPEGTPCNSNAVS